MPTNRSGSDQGRLRPWSPAPDHPAPEQAANGLTDPTIAWPSLLEQAAAAEADLDEPDVEPAQEPGSGPPLHEPGEVAGEPGEAEQPFEEVLFGPLAVCYSPEERHWAAWRCWQELLEAREELEQLRELADKLGVGMERR